VQVVRELTPGLTTRPTVLTMGKFDGLHLGHQQLILANVHHARQLGFLSAVLTWEPHPNRVLRPDVPLRLLTSLDEKIDLIGALGPDLLIIAPFTTETRATRAEDYMQTICAAIPLRELWVGEDFAMGRGRAGDAAALMTIGQQLGFAVGTVARVYFGETPVSASRVRELVQAGQVAEAVDLLGRRFALRGVVIEGDRRGRTIGFPTANLAVAEEHILPADGVYACQVVIGNERLPAVTNIGMRPTFDGHRRAVEAHLLDWSGDLYGQTITVEFVDHLRGERKFAGVAELTEQISRDIGQARALLGL
jgi:riboflavin kinase/FMN adenylyltransferase